MGQLVDMLLPLYLFMLIPIFIPMVSATLGAVFDRLRPREVPAAVTAVSAAKQRSAEARRRPHPAPQHRLEEPAAAAA